PRHVEPPACGLGRIPATQRTPSDCRSPVVEASGLEPKRLGGFARPLIARPAASVNASAGLRGRRFALVLDSQLLLEPVGGDGLLAAGREDRDFPGLDRGPSGPPP